MKIKLNPETKGKLLIALAMSMFAFIGPLLRISSLSNYALLFYSGLIGWIGLLLYFFLSKKISVILPIKEFKLQLLLGILASINLITYFEAFKRTSIANAVFPHYLAPIIAALFAPLLLKERLEKRTIAALLLSIAGLFLIVRQNGQMVNGSDGVGVLLAAISGIAYGFSILTLKRILKTVNPVLTIFYQVSFFVIFLPFLSKGDFILQKSGLIMVLVFAFLSVIPPIINFSGIKNVKAQHAGIIAYVEPLMAILYGFLFFGETLGFSTFLGGSLIILSGLLILKE